ncbi:zinc-ribbon domain-containing protein [Flavobacterium sp. XS1P27]|uniref:zinc ribbon domain-containing protein n=1 Tax=Flavobacterium sp. XS1P27 TaxID=3401724 RepID=UPI003AAC8DDD
MALIYCPECGTQVSEHAEYCVKCAYPIKVRVNNNIKRNTVENNKSIDDSEKTTDIFAIASFASGLGGFLILPILFVPIGYITSIISYYRLKENPKLNGKGLRIIGAILTTLNIFWLMYTFKIGFFSETFGH